MNKVWTVARRTYLTRLSRLGSIVKALLFGAIGLAALLGILALAVSLAGRGPDTDQHPESDRIGVLSQGGRPVAVPAGFAGRFVAHADEAEAKRALAAEEVATVIVLTEDPLPSGKLTAWCASDGYRLFSRGNTEKEVHAFLLARLLEGRIDPAGARRANEPVELDFELLGADGRPRPEAEVLAGRAGFVLSLVLLFFMHFSSGYLLNSLSEERYAGVLELVLSSVSPAQLLAGKAVGLFGVVLTWVAAGLLAAVVLSGGTFALLLGQCVALRPQLFGLAGVYFLLGGLFYGLLMMAAGTLMKPGFEAFLLSSLTLLVVVIPYVLVLLSAGHPSALAVRLLSVFPLTAPGVMLLRLALGPVPAADVIASLGVLLVSVPLLFFTLVRLFHTGLLLDGKPPGVRHLLGAFRPGSSPRARTSDI